MALPEKDIFETYLDYRMKLPVDIHMEISNLGLPTEKQIYDLCESLDELEINHINNLNKHAVRIWLNEQENFKRAMKTLSFKRKPLEFATNSEFKAYRVKEIKKRFEESDWLDEIKFDSNSTDAKEMKRIESRNKDFSSYNAKKRHEIFMFFYNPFKSDHLHFGLIKCFYDYYYSDRAKQLIRLKDNSIKLLNEIKTNLNDLSKLSILAEFIEGENVVKSWPMFGKGYFNLDRVASRFNDVTINIPFERNDKTLKERVLIYDLNKILRKYFRASKSNAIFYLLMLEGIENNIEQRSIERMLSKWNRH